MHRPGAGAVFTTVFICRGGPKEFLGLLIFIALFFLVLPFGIYAALPQHKTLYLALIYVADIVIVGGIYMWIGNHTKLQYAECLKEGRRILDQMHANDKKSKSSPAPSARTATSRFMIWRNMTMRLRG